MEDEKSICKCGGGSFPTFAVIILLLGVAWLLKDIGVITFDIPWLPVLVIIVALSLIFGHCKKK